MALWSSASCTNQMQEDAMRLLVAIGRCMHLRGPSLLLLSLQIEFAQDAARKIHRRNHMFSCSRSSLFAEPHETSSRKYRQFIMDSSFGPWFRSTHEKLAR